AEHGGEGGGAAAVGRPGRLGLADLEEVDRLALACGLAVEQAEGAREAAAAAHRQVGPVHRGEGVEQVDGDGQGALQPLVELGHVGGGRPGGGGGRGTAGPGGGGGAG